MATAHNIIIDAEPSIESFHVSIKHTFLHLEAKQAAAGGAQRRVARSLPPVLRAEGEVQEAEEHVFIDASPLKRDAAISDSTAWDASTASDVSSERGDASSDAGRLSVVTTASDFSAPATERPDKPRLNATAKIYVPPCAAAPPPQCLAHCKFTPQVQSAVEAVQLALLQTGLILSVTAHAVVQGWSVMVTIHPEYFNFRERILSSAKQALLHAAEQSESVYVLGYCSRPFVLTPLGFKAQLAGMVDESAACWDIFAKGTCRRSSCCTWQHPTFFSDVSVSLVLDCQGAQQLQ